MSSILERVRRWRLNAAMGPEQREARKTRHAPQGSNPSNPSPD
jgi:hypothetical protein